MARDSVKRGGVKARSGSNTRGGAGRQPRELSPDRVARELTNLNRSLVEPLTPLALHRWAVRDIARVSLFSDVIMGTIRWKKSLGRPVAANLADAFQIQHNSWKTVTKYENGAVHFIELIQPHFDISKWEGSAQPEHYEVHFMAASAPQGRNRIGVGLAPGIGWGTSRFNRVSVFRRIDPPERSIETVGTMNILDPFEVVTTFF